MVRKYKVEIDAETSKKRAHFLSDLSRLTLPAKHLALTKDGMYVAIASEGIEKGQKAQELARDTKKAFLKLQEP